MLLRDSKQQQQQQPQQQQNKKQPFDSQTSLSASSNKEHGGQNLNSINNEKEVQLIRIVADEEFIPFAPRSVDLIVSNLSLHWVNDLPGCLLQIRQSLKDDGLFLAAMLGGNTLFELRYGL
jgi:SAM-dependent methyltransferase